MNKNLLISAVLLTSTVGQLSAAEVTSAHSKAISTLEAKGKLSFVGSEVVTKDGTRLRPRLVLVPVKSGAYEFAADVPGDALGKEPGIDPKLEYQLVVTLVDIETGAVQKNSANYFAKVLDGGKLKAYFCDTTSVCSEDRGTKEITLEGDVLTLNGAEFFGNDLSGDLHFISISK